MSSHCWLHTRYTKVSQSLRERCQREQVKGALRCSDYLEVCCLCQGDIGSALDHSWALVSNSILCLIYSVNDYVAGCMCELKVKLKIKYPSILSCFSEALRGTNEMCPAGRKWNTSNIVAPPNLCSSRPKDKKIKGWPEQKSIYTACCLIGKFEILTYALLWHYLLLK